MIKSTKPENLNEAYLVISQPFGNKMYFAVETNLQLSPALEHLQKKVKTGDRVLFVRQLPLSEMSDAKSEWQRTDARVDGTTWMRIR